jgi:hypothetical protein
MMSFDASSLSSFASSCFPSLSDLDYTLFLGTSIIILTARIITFARADKQSPDKVGVRTIEIYQGNLSERRLYY